MMEVYEGDSFLRGLTFNLLQHILAFGNCEFLFHKVHFGSGLAVNVGVSGGIMAAIKRILHYGRSSRVGIVSRLAA